MPTIEELQRFQFEDFALENTRRGKLTVLGEHAFGAEQGRIVTAPVTSESESGGGAPSVKPTPCPEPNQVAQMTIQATLSGTLPGGSECTVPDTDFDINAVSETSTFSNCVSGAITEEVTLEFTCPGECLLPDDPVNTVQFEVSLNYSGVSGEHWYFQVNIFYLGTYFCGQDFAALGGDSVWEVDLGVGPPVTGPHTIEFDDPNFPSVHYVIEVTVTVE